MSSIKLKTRYHAFMRIILVYVSIFIAIGMVQMSLDADEDWPIQPHASNHIRSNLTLGTPPYFEGRNFVTPNEALFFKKRKSLENFKISSATLPKMILSGEVKRLKTGTILIARERIVHYEGRVNDKQLGDGYVVMRSPF